MRHAVDDVLLLGHGKAITGVELVHQRNQRKWAAPALLLFRSREFRDSLDPIAYS